MRVLVTGGKGFAGSHLESLLAARSHQVLSTSRRAAGGEPGLARLDLPDEARCHEILAEFRPDAVVHLAGISFVPDADRDPARAVEVNVVGTLGLLAALRRADPGGRTRVVHVSTGQVYDARTGGPFGENAPLRPASVYARTKLAAELAVEAWTRGEGRPAVIFRPFNHIGPGQRECFAVSNFAWQIARMEKGKADPVLHTGNLRAVRDFCDVRDVARAYLLAAEGSIVPGTYNVASGVAISLAAVVEALRSFARRPFDIHVEETLLRPGDDRHPAADTRLLRAASGWEPVFTLEDTIRDTLEWWRNVDHG
jgi:GDP-4-dehydro-6-deoxy-D-mannose reductase